MKMDDERRSGVTKTTRLYAHCGKIKDTLVLFGLNMVNIYIARTLSQCIKITQKASFELFEFGVFRQVLPNK